MHRRAEGVPNRNQRWHMTPQTSVVIPAAVSGCRERGNSIARGDHLREIGGCTGRQWLFSGAQWGRHERDPARPPPRAGCGVRWSGTARPDRPAAAVAKSVARALADVRVRLGAACRAARSDRDGIAVLHRVRSAVRSGHAPRCGMAQAAHLRLADPALVAVPAHPGSARRAGSGHHPGGAGQALVGHSPAVRLAAGPVDRAAAGAAVAADAGRRRSCSRSPPACSTSSTTTSSGSASTPRTTSGRGSSSPVSSCTCRQVAEDGRAVCGPGRCGRCCAPRAPTPDPSRRTSTGWSPPTRRADDEPPRGAGAGRRRRSVRRGAHRRADARRLHPPRGAAAAARADARRRPERLPGQPDRGGRRDHGRPTSAPTGGSCATGGGHRCRWTAPLWKRCRSTPPSCRSPASRGGRRPQTWSGVRLRDLAALAGRRQPDRATSARWSARRLQPRHAAGQPGRQSRRAAGPSGQRRRPVDGSRLSARIIVPALPGVHNTKWVASIEFGRPEMRRRPLLAFYGGHPLHLLGYGRAALAGYVSGARTARAVGPQRVVAVDPGLVSRRGHRPRPRPVSALRARRPLWSASLRRDAEPPPCRR